MSEAKILVVGSSNTDMTIKSRRLPGPGETVTGGTFSEAGGGKGANQAIAAARAGAAVTFVGCVGDDPPGRRAAERLRTEDINVDFLRIDPDVPSGVALIMVDANGENMISVAPGANQRLSERHVRQAEKAFEKADGVLLQLEIPFDAVKAAVELAATADVPVFLDPAPVPDEPLSRTLLEGISMITPNATELPRLAGLESDDTEAMARQLCSTGPGTVVVTLGAEGVLVCTPESCTHLPAAPADPVDTVGAGDAFSGALAVALAEGQNLEEAARFALCAAAISTETRGAQPSLAHRAEIETRRSELH